MLPCLSISISNIFILIYTVSSIYKYHESWFNVIFFDKVNCISSYTPLFAFFQWIIHIKRLVSIIVHAMRCWVKIFKSKCLYFFNSLIWNIWQQAFNYYRKINNGFLSIPGIAVDPMYVITTFPLIWCVVYFSNIYSTFYIISAASIVYFRLHSAIMTF